MTSTDEQCWYQREFYRFHRMEDLDLFILLYKILLWQDDKKDNNNNEKSSSKFIKKEAFSALLMSENVIFFGNYSADQSRKKGGIWSIKMLVFIQIILISYNIASKIANWAIVFFVFIVYIKFLRQSLSSF